MAEFSVTYTASFVLRRRPLYQRLLARLRPEWRRPLYVWVRPVCPECGEKVTGQTPRIVAGHEFSRGPATYRAADRVDGIALEPCGHRVANFLITEAFDTADFS